MARRTAVPLCRRARTSTIKCYKRMRALVYVRALTELQQGRIELIFEVGGVRWGRKQNIHSAAAGRGISSGSLRMGFNITLRSFGG